MNPWGIIVGFVGFLMLYIGVKGTQSTVVQIFSKSQGVSTQ